MQEEKKVVVITGTSSGIGLVLARHLSAQGFTVYGLSRTDLPDENFTTLCTDIMEMDSVRNSVDSIYDVEKRIDVLINNAGRGMVGAVEDASDKEIQSLFQLNVVGSVHLIQAVMPYFREMKAGKIINISSIGSEMGLPFRGYYSASKAALDKLTEALRFEVAHFGVEACVLHLGDIQTNIAQNRINSDVSEPYRSTFQKVYEGMNAHVEEGTQPENVALFVEKLLAKKSWVPHYYYGKPTQKLSIFLRKILPQKTFEKMLKNYSGL